MVTRSRLAGGSPSFRFSAASDSALRSNSFGPVGFGAVVAGDDLGIGRRPGFRSAAADFGIGFDFAGATPLLVICTSEASLSSSASLVLLLLLLSSLPWVG